ncbi:hypothetical protein IV203_016648 [Nitzschia inconspicua]|uniref:Uncharacterized protein n=1 Tax=Nitzschia inconspicua TaxID=303405 RepID=A0A9K3KRT6_9STRA|nr:hypothetical protein IV203_016648 [Nitzschia inconspicua]
MMPLHMAGGGRGWDNNDYLSSLSGDDEDREDSTKQYQEFSERRAAFQQRQEEYFKNAPQAAQAFLLQRQQQEESRLEEGAMLGDDLDDLFGGDGFEETSGGGTRMSRMMAQAQRMQQLRQNPMTGGTGVGGFSPKLAVPLDYEEQDHEDDVQRKGEDE